MSTDRPRPGKTDGSGPRRATSPGEPDDARPERQDPSKERAAGEAGGAGPARSTSARSSDITRLRAARSGLHRHAASVLVADDDASTRRMLEVALGRRGYAVRAASGGEEAIRLLRERPFDILLADIHMPDCDGLTLCEVARAMRPGMRLVLMTGFQTEESVLRAFRVGVSAYLRKPVRLPKLFRALARAARTLQGEPGTGGVRLEMGRLSGEAEGVLASPELVKAGIAFEPEGWISFEAPSHRVFLERFSNLSELLLTRVVDADTVDEVRAAVLELGSNAIEWGNDSDRRRPIRLSARALEDCIVVVVEDSGPGFRLSDVPDARGDARELQRSRAAAGKRPGGYGLAIVRAITDHLVHNERGNVVAMVKRIRPKPSAG